MVIKLVNIGLILAVAAVVIATRYTPADAQRLAPAAAVSVSPMDLMRDAKPLPQTVVENYI